MNTNNLSVSDIINAERRRYSWWRRASVWGETKFFSDVVTKTKSCFVDLGAAMTESAGLANRSRLLRNFGIAVLAIELIGLPIFMTYANPPPIVIGLYGGALGYTGNCAHIQHTKMSFYNTLAEKLN